MRLPTGTVTFLFTDIEGSTRLLHELGAEAYGAKLAEHRRLLREAFDRHQGVEVDMQGDSFCVAFRQAQDALAAAVDAQAALQGMLIRVRIGVHTGEPILAEEGYVGMDVHRAARIMSAGHGGQIVVSETTRAFVGGDVDFRDLGSHRLKDMTAPQRLYQLGDGDFPPLRSLNQTNLPVQPTSLVGRERELEELAELLARDDVRLVTLAGPGGTGKTRLGLQAAAEAVGRFGDGVYWVSLAPLPSHELVAAAVARALDLREVPGESLERTLLSFLSSRRLLLLLDNFEHVLEAGGLLAELLAGCAQLRLLVTSRATLALSSEHVYAVPPLREDEAVDLFVERARQAGAEVVANATVAAICGRLDRLPLAIELASARAVVLEPQALLERLERRLPLLKGGAPDLPARQRTLYATIAWSHDLLEEDERILFRRLSVFAGSFTVESAEAVAEADLWTLESLLAKSLVRRWGSGRLGLLETIREYAADQLEEAGESQRLENALARHYLELALSLAPYLSAGERRSASVDQLALELDNLRAAFVHLDRAEDGELLQLATAVWRFWMARGYFGTGRYWLERGLERAKEVSPDLRARALEGLGVMCLLAGDVDEGVRSTGTALELFRSLGDARGAAESLNNLATVAMSSADLEHAEQLLREAAELAGAAGEWHVVGLAVCNLAAVAVERGDDDGAIELLGEGTRIYAQIGDPGWLAMPQITLGRMLVDQGRSHEAARPLADGLASAAELPQRDFAAMGLVVVAAMAAEDGDPILGAELLGAVDGLYEAVGASWLSAVPADRATRARAFNLVRESLEQASFDAAYAVGRALTFDEAVAKALVAVETWRIHDGSAST